jgi:hypothetical protein
MSFIADAPWWVALVIIVIGLAILLAGNSRQASGMRNGGAGTVVLGLLIGILGFVLDSPRKAVARSTREFVDAVASEKWNDVQSMLAPAVRWDWPGQPWHADGAPAVLAGAKMVVKNSGMHVATAKQPQLTENGDTYTNACVVWISSDATGGASVDSDWQFTWHQAGDKWELTHLSVTRVDDSAPSGIRSTLDKH